MKAQEEDQPSRTRVYVPFLGKLNLNSFHELETDEDALAFWWAAALCQDPFIAFLWMELDGMQCNEHLKSQRVPTRLLQKVQKYIAENDEISFDAIVEQDRQSRDWRP